MNIMVATDGTLNPAAAAAAVERVHRPGDEVTVFTAVNFPREFLRDLGKVGEIAEVVEIADAVGAGMLGFASGAKAAERLAPMSKYPESEVATPLVEYFQALAERRMAGLRKALSDRGVEAGTVWRKTENQSFRTILEAADDFEVDLLIIGSHGRGRYDGMLGATGTKILRRASTNVLVLRKQKSSSD